MGLPPRCHVIVRDHRLAARFSRNGAILARSRGVAFFSISLSYASWITAQVVLYFSLIAFLFEGIFLSQHFIDVFGDNADEIGSLTDAIILVVLSAPEVHFVLPVAILTAVYLVVLRCRERRELIVFAGAGLGAKPYAVLAFACGIAALSASLVITGVILPHTRFALRNNLFEFRNEALKGGGASGHFYSFPRSTVFKWPGTGARDSELFIYQYRDDGVDRAISVKNARVSGAAGRDGLDLRFRDVVAIDVPGANSKPDEDRQQQTTPSNCPTCTRVDKRVMQIENYALTFDLERLQPRGLEAREWTSAELLAISPAPSGAIASWALRKELTDRLVRGLMCFVAPFLALLAVGWTTRVTQGFALPVACGILLCIDVIGLTIARMLDSWGVALAMASVAGIFVGVLALAIWQIGALQLALVRPALSKA
jgi:lipopolysaccharide export system permease protein